MTFSGARRDHSAKNLSSDRRSNLRRKLGSTVCGGGSEREADAPQPFPSSRPRMPQPPPLPGQPRSPEAIQEPGGPPEATGTERRTVARCHVPHGGLGLSRSSGKSKPACRLGWLWAGRKRKNYSTVAPVRRKGKDNGGLQLSLCGTGFRRPQTRVSLARMARDERRPWRDGPRCRKGHPSVVLARSFSLVRLG